MRVRVGVRVGAGDRGRGRVRVRVGVRVRAAGALHLGTPRALCRIRYGASAAAGRPEQSEDRAARARDVAAHLLRLARGGLGLG